MSDTGTPEVEEHKKEHKEHGKTKSARSSKNLEADFEAMCATYKLPGIDYASSLPNGSLDEQKTAVNAMYEPDARKFVVRSHDYPTSKVKVRSTASLLRFVAADLLAHSAMPKLKDACSHPSTLPALCPDRRFLVLNWQLPASPPFSYVVYFVVPTDEERAEREAELAECDREARAKAFALLERFCSRETTDEWRNNRFKLVPLIVEGPWLVKKVTPSGVPALIGNKLTTTYHWGPNYLEIDVDITSSTAANSIWSIVNRTLSSLVIDLAFVIQGNEEAELPEVIFGAVRIQRVSLSPKFVRQLE